MATPSYKDRTDSVATKLRLLEAAYAAGRLDLAMSLADSVKDTLDFERQLRPAEAPPQIPADAVQPVSRLPAPLTQWARGWSFFKPVALFETVGIARAAEPVELSIGFPADQIADASREVRVACWDAGQRQLREIPSQIDHVARRGGQIHGQLTFLADCAAHQPAHYLVFYGNQHAERPDYTTDLETLGDGCALDIANHHYAARLSRQSGQLERITYARQHGLELYAGGKGHGEPPGIDWAHDYVDEGQFQKLRMRNWSRCANYEVVRGPISVQVRRWGFPHSPVHPLFTPSRMHMDISYTFYAGQPYFVKQGRMDMIQDFRIETMRDDEWVFSGYSFTDTVWIDTAGRLHEGAVPPEQRDTLWGVGFFNRVSRDAFIALRLEHAAQGIAQVLHSGEATLHYDGHGQLWSRSPSGPAQMQAGSSVWQKNAYLLAPYPERDAAASIAETRHRLLNPLEVRAQPPAGFTSAATSSAPPLARYGETPDAAPLKPAIWQALRDVRDEQLYAIDSNVVDLGYVYDVRERNGSVRVLVTMPHRGRPVYQFLESQGGGRISDGIRERLLKLPGVRDVVVDFTWEPPWTSARLTAKGRAALGLPD